jgi:predicted nucleic acid-binding protein
MKKCLLDSSFLVDLLNEIASAQAGPATSWLRRNSSAHVWISPVTMAEVLEGAEEPTVVRTYLARYSWQGIHRAHADKVALRQRRASHRLGENDAWQVAIAEQMGAVLVGHDSAAFERLGAEYDDFRSVSSKQILQDRDADRR